MFDETGGKRLPCHLQSVVAQELTLIARLSQIANDIIDTALKRICVYALS